MREGRNGGKLKSGGNNGGGRPPKLPDLDVLIAECLSDEKNGVTAAAAILSKWLEMAKKGNLKAGEMLFDRGYGKPKQTLDVSVNKTATADHINPDQLAEIERILNAGNGKSDSTDTVRSSERGKKNSGNS